MKLQFRTELYILFAYTASCTPNPGKEVTKEKELTKSPLLADGFEIYGATVVVKNVNSARNYYKNVMGFRMPEKFEIGIYDGTQTARSEAGWYQSHIPGAVSVPYYKQPDKFIKDIPNDSTWVVVYCACPHAASSQVVNTLKRFGYKHTAILDEGVLVWTNLGYPVQFGQGKEAKK